jgi:hypothetical protein
VPGVGVPATRDPLTGWLISVTNPTGTGEGIYDRNVTATLTDVQAPAVVVTQPVGGAGGGSMGCRLPEESWVACEGSVAGPSFKRSRP